MKLVWRYGVTFLVAWDAISEFKFRDTRALAGSGCLQDASSELGEVEVSGREGGARLQRIFVRDESPSMSKNSRGVRSMSF